MKGGFCFTYTWFLAISVISSCALFILVVSEALQDNEAVTVDLSGLHNITKVKTISGSHDNHEVSHDNYELSEDNYEVGSVQQTLVPSDLEVQDGVGDAADGIGDETTFDDQEMTFAGALSLNSVTTDGLPDTGQPPMVISLGDNAKLDLKPDELLYTNESDQRNDSKAFNLVDSPDPDKPQVTTEPRLVVKAKPMHEIRQEDLNVQIQTPLTEEPESQDIAPEIESTTKPDTPHEDIPSFSEWAQKQLAEAEKMDTVLNHSSQPSHSSTNFSSKTTKVRSKNYAAPACGAKIVAVNPEAGSTSSILSPNKDEYMLNTCNSRIWFVVELCEAVQAQKIEIANFELFSSTPKDFAVYFSDRFPTREWASVGQFTAQDVRDVQSFDLFPHIFGKFIKVEMLSHHGSEHYCPISLFKVYGTSEFEVLEKESSHATHIEDEDDELIDVPDIPAVEVEPSKNLFGSARDAVMSIMKKAAQVLVKTEVPKNVSSAQNDSSTDQMYKRCCSPSHIIVCDNCSETLYNEVYELISCDSEMLTNLLGQVFLRETLKCTDICLPFGLDFKSTKTIEFITERVDYVNAFIPQKYLAALCNMLAIKEKKVVLNTSYESDITVNITLEDITENDDVFNNSNQELKLAPDTTNKSDEVNDTIETELPIEVTTENLISLDVPKEENETTEKTEEQETIPESPAQDSSDEQTIENDKLTETVTEDSSKIDTKNGKPEVEKTKESSEELEVLDSDSFMSDFDQMAVDPTPAGAPATPNTPATTLQKESVFLRLSNRVKTLERNMSLSGQYLEELSRRYKKQVEEMQKTFEKTVQQMTDERKKTNEREQKYLEHVTNLQEQIIEMAKSTRILMEARDSWFGTITFFKFVVFQTAIVAAVFYYMSRKRKMDPVLVPIPKKTKKKDKLRRKSVEGVSGHATPSAKKRRPSEEALQIARQSAEEMSRDEDEGEWQIARKNRRRKTSIIHRNMDRNLWGRQDSIGKLLENPIPLDEEEFFAPVTEPVLFNSVDPPNPPKKAEPLKSNSFFNNLKNKTMKTRRLSSPAFLRTFSRQSTRSTPSPVVRTLDPILNGNVSVNNKAASESPTGSLWSASTEVSQNGPGSVTLTSANNNNRKKKILKSMFKKVF